MKKRRDYLDNTYYVDGVKNKEGEYLMQPLDDDAKEWLNQFNAEYYGASFKEDDSRNLHQTKVDDVTIYNIRQELSELRKKQYKTKDVEELKGIYADIEDIEAYLVEVYPKKACQDANNERNRCILNHGKATNKVKLVPWETLDQNMMGEKDVEILKLISGQEEEDEE